MKPRFWRALAGSSLISLSFAAVPSEASARIVVSGDPGGVPLGTGYDATTQRMLDVCVEGKVIQVGGEESLISTDLTKDFDTMRRTMDGSVGIGVDVGIFGASEEVDYLSRTSRESLREGVVLEFQAQVGSFLLEPNVTLSPTGQSVAAMSDPYQRRLRCGTEFVEQVDLGYRLRVSLTVTFRSYSSYERFVEHHSVSALFGLFKSSWDSIQELKQYGEDIVIEASALQEGGRKDRLDRILQGKSLCTGTDAEACSNLVRDLFDYASSPGGFRADMGNPGTYDPTNIHGPVVLRYLTATYEESGIENMKTVGAPSSTLEALAGARQRLEAVLVGLTSDLQKATVLLATTSTAEKRAALQDLEQKLQVLRDATRARLDSCQSPDSSAECAKDATNLEEQARKLDRSALQG